MIHQQGSIKFWNFNLCVYAGGFWSPYATYIFISLVYASVAGCLVSFVEPLAAGSGIAEIKTYLNGIHIKGLLTVSCESCPNQDFLFSNFVIEDLFLMLLITLPDSMQIIAILVLVSISAGQNADCQGVWRCLLHFCWSGSWERRSLCPWGRDSWWRYWSNGVPVSLAIRLLLEAKYPLSHGCKRNFVMLRCRSFVCLTRSPYSMIGAQSHYLHLQRVWIMFAKSWRDHLQVTCRAIYRLIICTCCMKTAKSYHFLFILSMSTRMGRACNRLKNPIALICRAIYRLSRGKASGKTPRRIGGYFRNDADHRDFTAIGTAAGAH